MSLPGFCNHAKDRAHRADVRTSHRNSASGDPKRRNHEGFLAVVSSKGIPEPYRLEPYRPKSFESACARRQQRPTRTRPNAHLSPSEARLELEAPTGFTRPRLPSDRPHERLRPLERPRALSTAWDPDWSASPCWVSQTPPPRRRDRRARFFHRRGFRHHDGQTKPSVCGGSTSEAVWRWAWVGVARSAPISFYDLVVR